MGRSHNLALLATLRLLVGTMQPLLQPRLGQLHRAIGIRSPTGRAAILAVHRSRRQG